MPVTPLDQTRAGRTQTWLSGLVDKSATTSTEIAFATGRHKAKITKTIFTCTENFATADADVDIGFQWTPGNATPDADAYADTLGFLNANKTSEPLASVTDIDAGVWAEHNLDIVIPERTIVLITFVSASGAGEFYTILEVENVQEIPPSQG